MDFSAPNHPGLLTNRRAFFSRTSLGLGGVALASLLGRDHVHAEEAAGGRGILGFPHAAPKAKRAIYLFMSGGPSQMDLLDPKPELNKQDGKPIPNLYAAGELLGAGQFMGRSYCGGMLVTPALTFGRLLGQRMLKFDT